MKRPISRRLEQWWYATTVCAGYAVAIKDWRRRNWAAVKLWRPSRITDAVRIWRCYRYIQTGDRRYVR